MMKRKTLLIGVMFAFCISLLAVNSAAAFPGFTINGQEYYCDLTFGEYCDVDADGEEDDLRITAELFTLELIPRPCDLEMVMLLLIELPSGEEIIFAWEVNVYFTQDFSLEFQVNDGALEEGWYDTYLFICHPDFEWINSDFICFDPPLKTGNSDPTCTVLIS